MLDIAQEILDRAKQQGATAADVIISSSRSVSAAVRQGEVESVENEESQDLSLRVVVEGRVASTSGNLSDPDALSAMAERAVAMAKVAPVDPLVVLATSDQFATSWPDLDLFDPSELSPSELIDLAQRCEAKGLAGENISNSGGASASFGRSDTVFATSEGFANARKSSLFGYGLSLITGPTDAMQRDYASDSARHFEDLDSPEDVGELAAERTAKRLGAKPRAGGQLPVVFDPRVSSILGSLLGSIGGSSIARGTSFLKGHLNKQILPQGISVVDRPQLLRGRRSRAVDAEGLPTTDQLWVEDGVLKQWILDLSTAKKLGLASNACAARGLSGPPSPSPSNVTLEGGSVDPDQAIADIKEGLYVTEMMGHGLNSLTGDYSRGAGGFWIRDGKLAEPVSEMTIASNMLTMMAEMIVCSDLKVQYGIDSPTIVIPKMSIAGAD